MKQQVPDEDFIRRYLLGELPEEARQRIEERLFADDEFYDAYLSAEDGVEDALIDQYVGGEMSARERQQFDHVFLSTPGRVEKLKLVQALHGYVNPPAPGPHTRSLPLPLAGADKPFVPEAAGGGWRLPAALTLRGGWLAALASVLVLAAVCAGLFYLKARRLEEELAALRAQQQQPPPTPTPNQNLEHELSNLRARNDELAAALRRAEEQRASAEQRLSSPGARVRDAPAETPRPTPRPRPSMPTLALALIRDREQGDGQANQLKLPPGVPGVRLVLGLDTIDPSDYSSFRAVVSAKDGAVVVTRDRLRASVPADGEPRVGLTIPASRLSAVGGDYVVKLSGRSKGGGLSFIGAYGFRVTRE